MPTYEYGCTACGQHIEVFQRFSEDALTTCGVCGGSLRKVFHPAGIVFKGSGFYATDSRSKKPTTSGAKKEGDTGPGAADSGSSGSGSSGSDGKPSGSKPSSAGPSSSGDGGSPSKTSTTTEAS
jgi:putative FmdB family regulatory protein